jgi:hypothetical protein
VLPNRLVVRNFAVASKLLLASNDIDELIPPELANFSEVDHGAD